MDREIQAGSARLCPRFHHAIELIGRRWSGALIMLLVQRDSARYSDLLAAIPGISDRLLSERLRELESEGIVARSVEPGPPVRVSYRLTEAGRALEPAIFGLARWADTWIPQDPQAAKIA
jgi:DNA-binding HxlR family transcriptional regulator